MGGKKCSSYLAFVRIFLKKQSGFYNKWDFTDTTYSCQSILKIQSAANRNVRTTTYAGQTKLHCHLDQSLQNLQRL